MPTPQNPSPVPQVDLTQLLSYLTVSSDSTDDVTDGYAIDYQDPVPDALSSADATISAATQTGPYKYGTAVWGLAQYS